MNTNENRFAFLCVYLWPQSFFRNYTALAGAKETLSERVQDPVSRTSTPESNPSLCK